MGDSGYHHYRAAWRLSLARLRAAAWLDEIPDAIKIEAAADDGQDPGLLASRIGALMKSEAVGGGGKSTAR